MRWRFQHYLCILKFNKNPHSQKLKGKRPCFYLNKQFLCRFVTELTAGLAGIVCELWFVCLLYQVPLSFSQYNKVFSNVLFTSHFQASEGPFVSSCHCYIALSESFEPNESCHIFYWKVVFYFISFRRSEGNLPDIIDIYSKSTCRQFQNFMRKELSWSLKNTFWSLYSLTLSWLMVIICTSYVNNLLHYVFIWLFCMILSVNSEYFLKQY